MFLLVLITLSCGGMGIYYSAQITDQNPCSGIAQYAAFCPATNTFAVFTLRTDINEQISTNLKKFVPSITSKMISPVLVTQLKSHPLFSIHCLLIV